MNRWRMTIPTSIKTEEQRAALENIMFPPRLRGPGPAHVVLEKAADGTVSVCTFFEDKSIADSFIKVLKKLKTSCEYEVVPAELHFK